MTKDELTKKLEDNGTLILDIREREELQNTPKIGGAEHMPMGKVFTEAAKGNLPKNKKIVTVCQSGGRCQVLVDALKEKGFDNIDYLEGGMNEWAK